MAYTVVMSVTATKTFHFTIADRGSSLGLKATSTNKLIEELERGLPFKALERLTELSGDRKSVV